MTAPDPTICLWCEEPILEGEKKVYALAVFLEQGSPRPGEAGFHHDCMMRSIVGGVGCQLGHPHGWCDAPGLSKRRAAMAAASYARIAHKINAPVPPIKAGRHN